ncbi:MAG: hypothetical protein AB1899_12980 [Pseudomonadota bacterium]
MSEVRRAPLPRWLGVAFRAVHLATVVGLGAALLGAPLDGHAQALGVLFSGAAMMALDLWMKPHLLREWSGAALLLKLGVVAWMAVDAGLRLPLFWGLVLWSAVFAHAPASFRHAPWWRRAGEGG